MSGSRCASYSCWRCTTLTRLDILQTSLHRGCLQSHIQNLRFVGSPRGCRRGTYSRIQGHPHFVPTHICRYANRPSSYHTHRNTQLIKAEDSVGSEDEIGRGREGQKSEFTARTDSTDNLFMEDVSANLHTPYSSHSDSPCGLTDHSRHILTLS